ncbi:MAG TPA: CAP domain-containing protein [Gemmatales bacterium]|nr:CAP domain-containing protein [Gemmatales bacterium]
MMRVVGLSVALMVLIPSIHKLKPAEPVIPELVKNINNYRARHGLPPMIYSPELQKAAERHAADMAAYNRMSHTGSDGSNFSMRARAAGFPMMGGGEIVAGGNSHPDTTLRC